MNSFRFSCKMEVVKWKELIFVPNTYIYIQSGYESLLRLSNFLPH